MCYTHDQPGWQRACSASSTSLSTACARADGHRGRPSLTPADRGGNVPIMALPRYFDLGILGVVFVTNASAAMKLRIAVLFGGRSAEHDVSVLSATNVMRALDPARYDAVPDLHHPRGALAAEHVRGRHAGEAGERDRGLPRAGRARTDDRDSG